MTRFTLEELRERLARYAHLKPGSQWIHTATGNEYVLVGVCIQETTCLVQVVYILVDEHYKATPVIFVRPAKEWEELVKRPGLETKPRFIRMEGSVRESKT